jgi:PPK2 family polyphosphate:nucleotide phosphotransferase
MRDRLRVEPGTRPGLARRDPADTLGQRKPDAQDRLAELAGELSVLQYRLWAEHRRSVLLVLQGLDAAGKDSTIRRVFTGLNPQGCVVKAFKRPAGEELEHDYLWRVHRATPERGDIGIFNRSHYEDVVAARLLGVIGDGQRDRRYKHIRGFEQLLRDEGTALVKVFLHVSREKQAARLRKRLADPEKRWKFHKEDLDSHARYDELMSLYEAALGATSTNWAPWYVVPADHKWVSGVAVASLLVETLHGLNPKIPSPTEDLQDLHDLEALDLK